MGQQEARAGRSRRTKRMQRDATGVSPVRSRRRFCNFAGRQQLAEGAPVSRMPLCGQRPEGRPGEGCEVGTVDHLHDDPIRRAGGAPGGTVVLLQDVVDLNDTRMREAGGGAGFAPEGRVTIARWSTPCSPSSATASATSRRPNSAATDSWLPSWSRWIQEIDPSSLSGLYFGS
jgi:hypothetical protein